jgi:hypothetical protein
VSLAEPIAQRLMIGILVLVFIGATGLALSLLSRLRSLAATLDAVKADVAAAGAHARAEMERQRLREERRARRGTGLSTH